MISLTYRLQNIPKEKRIIGGIIIALLVIITLPSVYGYVLAESGERFTGIRSFVPGDIFVYYSYIEQVRQGAHLLENLYTTEYGRPFLNIFWQSTGYIGKWFHLTPDLVFLLLRIVLGGLFLYTIYAVVKFFSKWQETIIWQFLFTVLACGLGVYHLIFNFDVDEYTTSLDVWTPEHNIITAIVASPHFIASFMLILVSLFLGYKAITGHSIKHAVAAGFTGLLLFQFHPYYVPLIYGVLGIFYVVQSFQKKSFNVFKALQIFLPIVLISIPSIIYHFYLLLVDEVFIVRAVGNVLPFPPLHVVLISYGIYLPLAVAGLIKIIRNKQWDSKNVFIVTWFVVQGLLLVAPIGYQRKLIAMWIVPMALLAWEGGKWLLEYYAVKYNKKISYALIIAIFFVFTPSTFYNLVRDFSLYNSDTSKALEYEILWLSADRQEAYAWLQQNVTNQEPILAHLDTAVTIPAFAGRRVYIGHWSETIYSEDSKKYLVSIFFSKRTSDEWKRKFLHSTEVAYVWWGPLERRDLGEFFNPEDYDFLEPVFENNEVTLYKTRL